MDPRYLRAAVTLAETRHFGRAADVLYLSQPALSQQIARLELQVGVRLFDRGPREVRLTPAGEAFVARAVELLRDTEAAVAEARQIAQGYRGELTIGFFGEGAAELTAWVVDAYQRAQPDVTLRFAELSMADQFDRLISKSIDVAFLRPPAADERILMQPLYVEPCVAALPAHHALADADELTVADLIDENFATAAEPTPPEWRGFWAFDSYRGEPSRTAADVNSIGESLAAIAYLDAVDSWPLSASRRFQHDGVRFTPVSGQYTAIAVAQRRDDDRAGVQAFCDLAVRVAREHVGEVAGAVLPEDAPAGTLLPSAA